MMESRLLKLNMETWLWTSLGVKTSDIMVTGLLKYLKETMNLAGEAGYTQANNIIYKGSQERLITNMLIKAMLPPLFSGVTIKRLGQKMKRRLETHFKGQCCV